MLDDNFLACLPNVHAQTEISNLPLEGLPFSTGVLDKNASARNAREPKCFCHYVCVTTSFSFTFRAIIDGSQDQAGRTDTQLNGRLVYYQIP